MSIQKLIHIPSLKLTALAISMKSVYIFKQLAKTILIKAKNFSES